MAVRLTARGGERWQDSRHARPRCCCSTAPACGSARTSGSRRRSPSPDGRPVNAVRGFIDSMAVVITQQRPSRLVVCLDLDWRPQFRVDLIPSYKAHRVAEAEPAGRARRRGSARRADAAGRHDHGAAGRVRDPDGGRSGFRGRRRARHAGGAGTPRPGRRRQRRPRPDAGGVRRSGAGSGALPGPRAGQGHAVRARRGGRTLWRAARIGPGPPTPSSRCCAAIRPTACRACRASARRPRPRCWPSTARWSGSWPPLTTRNRSWPRACGRNCWARPTTSRPPAQVVRVATDAPVTLSTPTDALPLVAADPKRTAELATAAGCRVVDRAAAEGARQRCRD